ncbi:MAG TPA: LuxR C-terminal-related transcriptional regulator [Thermomicrobiales bacterium]|nr:LuxR C-terminal-related transcriptional regulator [Thermomicrobiales bacterium]
MQAIMIDRSEDSRQLALLHGAECQLIDAIATARETIARCEQALASLSEARSQIAAERLSPPSPAARFTSLADTLFLSPRTIERHIANIYLKIDAHSKAEATAYARRNGIV